MSSTSASSEREFVDTNVLVYAHDEAAGPKREQALTLLDRLWRSGIGAISTQVLQEFYVVVTAKILQPVSSDAAAGSVRELRQWMVHSPAVDDLLAAIDLHRRHTISLWDAMIVRSAQRLGCGILWTEDLSPGQMYDGVRVVNPFEG